MRFFYVTIFVLRVEGATAEECEVNKLCGSTKCNCVESGSVTKECEGDKVCVPEGSGKKLIPLTATNKLEPGKPATAEKHFCLSAVGLIFVDFSA